MTKGSNCREILVLDVEERLREVESEFLSFKDAMNESLAGRNSLEEVVELSKSRGMCPIILKLSASTSSLLDWV